MKITDITISVPCYVDLPMQGDARQRWGGPRPYAFLEVTTDEEITGISPVSYASEIRTFILDVYKPLILGEDPFEVERIWEKVYWTYYGNIRRGAPIRALSYIDIAIWDLIGKACGQPIHRLLGGHRRAMPAYGSGLNLNLGMDELVEQNQKFQEMGFKMVKMKIGQKDLKEDLKRIKAVRDTVGDDIDIAVDANNMYGVNTAIAMAQKMERYDIYWFEEPVMLDNLEGIIRLAKATSIPIAGYELENTKYGFKELIARGAISICQADAVICGGITEWKKIAALAECYEIPMAPHGDYQLHTPLAAAVPNGLIIECVYDIGAQFAQLLENPIIPKKGIMRCKTTPGLGITVRHDAVKKFGAKPEYAATRTMNERYRWPPYA
jgi:L-alanine-DL-glutamate epimerase-like enolase superfamily enzyme